MEEGCVKFNMEIRWLVISQSSYSVIRIVLRLGSYIMILNIADASHGVGLHRNKQKSLAA